MESSKVIASGVIWTTVVNIVNGLYGFVSVPILIAYFGKSDYGLIGLAMSVNVYLRLMDLGFNSTNIRYFSNWLANKDYTKVSRLFQTSLSFYGTLGLLNAVILLVVSYYSNSIFNLDPGQDVIIKNLFYILAISAFISWYTSCFEQIIRANELVGWIQKLNLLPKIAQIIILILTVLIGFSIEWYYALTTFSMILIIPSMIWKIRKICPFVSFVPSFDTTIFKTVLPYSLNIFSFGIFQFSIMYLRPVFLGMQSTPESITDYRIIEGVVKLVILLGGAFMGVLLPSASKIVAMNDETSYNRIAYQGTKFVSIAVCFFCFGMMSVITELLTVYVGSDYLSLTLWLDLWLLATLGTHNQAISSLILAGSNIKAITYCTVAASVIGLISCWFLIPYFDVGGTVISYCIYCLIQILFFYLYYWPKVLKVDSRKVFLNSFLPYVCIGGIICVGLRILSFQSLGVWPSLIIKAFIFAILFGCLTYIALDRSDKQFVLNIIKKK